MLASGDVTRRFKFDNARTIVSFIFKYALDITIFILFFMERRSTFDNDDYRFARIWIEVELVGIILEPLYFQLIMPMMTLIKPHENDVDRIHSTV
jgi:hypothetical protein